MSGDLSRGGWRKENIVRRLRVRCRTKNNCQYEEAKYKSSSDCALRGGRTPQMVVLETLLVHTSKNLFISSDISSTLSVLNVKLTLVSITRLRSTWQYQVQYTGNYEARKGGRQATPSITEQ